MRIRHCLVSLILFSAAPALADEPQLPPDGSWARYYVQHITCDQSEYNHEIIISWLGTTTVDGEKCRWVEIQYPADKSVPKPWTGATRLAIPETLILTGKNLITDDTHGIYYYKQEGSDRELATIADKRKKGTVFVHDMMFGSYLQFLPGPRTSAKVTLADEVVLHQKGKVVATRELSGQRQGEYSDSLSKRVQWAGTYKILTSEDVPFGFASAEFEWETTYPDNPTLEPSDSWVKRELWTLQEFGTGAKSAIPENE